MAIKLLAKLECWAVVGPTASGKTDYAIKLAKKMHGFVISADSRQIYKHAQIGTSQPIGKWQSPSRQWRTVFKRKKLFLVNGVPHFFVDELSPNQKFSAAKFQGKVYRLLRQAANAKNPPTAIIVGGTGLYLSAVIKGYQFPASKPNLKLRNDLDKQDTLKLLALLKRHDLETYKAIDKNNRRRLIRALEHVISTGGSFLATQAHKPQFDIRVIGINPGKQQLNKRITQRSKNMIQCGLVKETARLLKHYPTSILLSTIGYKELVPYLKGEYGLGQAIELINLHTRQYAKRQLTWFKRLPGVVWYKKPQNRI